MPSWREARSAQGIRPEDPGPLKDTPAPKNKKAAAEPDLKADLKAKYWQKLTDGIEDEKKALEIDPEYENAMAYMNLLIRYRADLDDTKEQYTGRRQRGGQLGAEDSRNHQEEGRQENRLPRNRPSSRGNLHDLISRGGRRRSSLLFWA